MRETRRRLGITAAGISFSIALILASCSEAPVTPKEEGFSPGAPLLTLSPEFTPYEFLGFVTDDNGANDTPAQSDLNAFTRADNIPGKIGVKWVWDDIDSWTGSGQTGDACALFDTDNDGKANAAVCVRISNPNGDPTVTAQLAPPASPLVYSCGDNKNERCSQPVASKPLKGTICEVEKITGETFFAAGEDGADIQAACSIPDSAISASSTPNLLNVCSFPSGSPNSNPFDCVVTPGAGFLVIKKVTSPQNSGQTFSFIINPAVVSGTSKSLKDSTTGDEQTALLSATPGSYSVTEGSIPTGWSLTAASCARQTSPTPTATGTKTGNAVNGISVTGGETTICTFTNGVVSPTISVVKTASPDSIPETGGSVSYSVVVTNGAAIPVTLDSLVDNVFGNLNGQGTCGTAGNPYGSIAVGGTYSCSFSQTLSASNAGQTHVNQVSSYVSSDGGPASASDTARVRYIDVKPNISVTKTADDFSIAAVGGDSVTSFAEDARFARAGGGGGGGTTPVFGTDVCDDAGPNDEPAQSDLNCFGRADNVTGRLWIHWTWDDINSWTGSGQTGDACALLDTDNNSKANFAFCARITNPGGDPTVIAQAEGSPILYKCKDAGGSGEIDRCASKTLIQSLDASSICTISLTGDQMAGGEDGADSKAECNLKLSDLGNVSIVNIDLLNVCSFPSGSPNSNPFDCVITPAAGFLVIVESTTPSNADAYFAFTLRNSANTANAATTNGEDQWEVQGGAESAPLPILPGTYAVAQLMPTNWNQTSISCTRDGNNVGNTSDSTRLNVTIVQGATTTCTFNNSLVASQTITFTVTVTNNSLEDVTLFSLEDTENPDDATPTYSTLAGVGDCATGGTIVNGTPYSCQFTRVVSGTPGTQHKDKVRAVGQDNDSNSDTKISNQVTVVIN